MEYFAGIDVSLEQSRVSVVDVAGKIVREAKVASEPDALVWFFSETHRKRRPLAPSGTKKLESFEDNDFSPCFSWQLGLQLRRVGLGAGPLSQWLQAGLTAARLEVAVLETRLVKAVLSAMVVKTDRKDARGIAQLLRIGCYRPVHVKSPAAQEVRALLVGRKLLQTELIDVELSIRGILRGFGPKMGPVSKARFAARVQELVSGHAMLEPVLASLPRAPATLREEFAGLHCHLLAIVREETDAVTC